MEESMGLFSIVCHRVFALNPITLFFLLIQNYFKDACISYRTAILLSHNINQLVI